MNKNPGKFSALFLVAGTCIGGGMLALPIGSGIAGFIPSTTIMIACWLAMTLTALMLLEATLWMEEEAHIITMTSKILGPIGKGVSWILYLFIGYGSLVAYTAGGGAMLASSLSSGLHLEISKQMGALLFLALFGGVIYLGHRLVGRVNSILFIAMIAAYFGLVGFGLEEVKQEHFNHTDWYFSALATPLLLTAFSFQTMVPSLTPYLKRDVKSLKFAIIGGTALACLIYLVWQWIVLGIVPVEGADGLAYALAKGDLPATEFLRVHVAGKWLSKIADFFAFFAIATSFLGIALGLFDFLADGLALPKKGWGKIAIGLLIAVPTYLLATQFERAFMVAMDATGGYGDSIFSGMIPVLLIWRGRYLLGYSGPFRLMGGRPLLTLVFLFFAFVLGVELISSLGWVPDIAEKYNIYHVAE